MIVKVNRGEFLKKLRTVEKAVSENKIKPIISCVYLEAKEENTLFFCGTNLELTITSIMESEVLEKGKIVFQPQIIDEYVKELSDDVILLKSEDSTLIIETGDSSSEFSLMNADEFPMVAGKNNALAKYCFTIASRELLEIFEKVKFSAATSSDNLSLNCIRLDMQGKIARFVSTDTYRLTYLMKEVDSECEIQVSIPLNTVEAITRLLKSEDLKDIKVSAWENQIYFISDNTEMVSRTIELPYPNYGGILGTAQYNKKMVIKTDELMKILRRIQIFVRSNLDSKYGAVFELGNKIMVVRGVSSTAKIKEELNVNYTGDDLKISLNVKFLLEFLQNFDKESDIVVEFKESNSSVRIASVDDENYIYVVMPLALKDI